MLLLIGRLDLKKVLRAMRRLLVGARGRFARASFRREIPGFGDWDRYEVRFAVCCTIAYIPKKVSKEYKKFVQIDI